MEMKQGPEAAEPSTGSETGAKKSVWAIVIGVFTAPKETFSAYNERPRILVPLIVAVILACVYSYFFKPYDDAAGMAMLRQSSRLTPEMVQQMEQQSLNPGTVGRVISAIVMVAKPVAITLIGGLAAWLIGTFFFGGKTTFRKIWGVTILGSLITSLGGILLLPLVVAKNSVLISLGPAAIYPHKELTSVLYLILSYWNLFAIWSVIVTGIGYAAIYGFPQSKGITISVILTVLATLLMVGAAYVGMGFAGVDIHFL